MYFETAGRVNTDQTLRLAYERGQALGLNEVVVATTSGDTAYKALERMPDCHITAVTYHCGFKEPFKNQMAAEVRQDLERKGVMVVAATHALSGVERSISTKFGGTNPVLIIADTLRRFGQGTKVAVEVAIMAADAGTLTGADVIAIGGSGKGADTALILAPQNQSAFFDLKIRETICKPRSF